MAYIKEPLDVDFFVEPIPLSDAERKAISSFIESYKKNSTPKKQPKKGNKKKLPITNG